MMRMRTSADLDWLPDLGLPDRPIVGRINQLMTGHRAARVAVESAAQDVRAALVRGDSAADARAALREAGRVFVAGVAAIGRELRVRQGELSEIAELQNSSSVQERAAARAAGGMQFELLAGEQLVADASAWVAEMERAAELETSTAAKAA